MLSSNLRFRRFASWLGVRSRSPAQSRTALALVLLLLAWGPSACRAEISTVLDVFPVDPLDGEEVFVGDVALGYLTIDQGSVLISEDVIIGNEAEAIGFASVGGFVSGWSTLDLTVGEDGIGRLEVFDGALVDVDFDGGVADLVIGRDAGSHGEVLVSGFQSILSMGDDTTVGLNGTGLLWIENEGFVDATDNPASSSDVFTVGSEGRVELSDGWLRTGTLINNGEIIGDGRVNSATAIQNNGRIETVSGERLVIDSLGGVDNHGEIAIFGGEVDLREGVVNHPDSEITLLGGVIHLPKASGLTNGGVLATTGGVSDIYGEVQNLVDGTIVVAGDSTAVFHDPVTNQGGAIEVFPGSTALFLSDLAMGAGSLLSLRLGGSDDQTEIGEVEVAGDAALGGDLAIALSDGFMPGVGDAFQLLTSGGNLTGSLNLAATPGLPNGLEWKLDVVNGNSLVLSVAAIIVGGDYNANGVVDAADYTVWRDTLGQTGAGLAADGNGDGLVDNADYEVWKGHFGATASASGARSSTSPVPEPHTWIVLLGGTVLLPRRRDYQRCTRVGVNGSIHIYWGKVSFRPDA